MAFHSQRKNPYESFLKFREQEDGDITKLFDSFYKADSFQQIKDCFDAMCKYLEVDPNDHCNFYSNIKNKLNVWRAKAFFAKLDVKRAQYVYESDEVGKDIKALVIGGGPCGLRAAIEIALLGGKCIVLEKRSETTRNNVLALWPYVVEDLKGIGAKDFFPGFCVGGKDHISIRQLQCVLMKTALLLGVEIHIDAEYKDLVEPPDDQSSGMGWRCLVEPSSHSVSNYQFNTVIGADGKRHGLSGFKWNEFRGKLAIAITANFINRKTRSDSMVPEICGLSYIYDQQFFKDIKSKTDTDLENIVYYKASTHYFVFTAKKESLLLKGVLKQDYGSPSELLSKDNVNRENLIAFAREIADKATSHQIKNLEFALNKDSKEDVAMFDFTCLCSAQYASRFVERKGHRLLASIVGDSLLEPFWPTGTGAAIGFLGVFDSIWMIKQWFSGQYQPLEVLAEREMLYQILPQCTVKSLFKDYKQFSIDPSTRLVLEFTTCML
ncbi:hypothetical protein LOTGIDRAFT_106467 [Lottia gigantea]|uniref:Uncharacterized protein n=1 Tax=Lottia gigantea TaxID=225164 RepID=V4A315_LOTGI|nr:hypothetical protein LOTGIDRAFT_106467 [Lottia gigantea]ESO89320.1 hypothetical protein LOTGIDRAFT_106467 [Lottia gigantea]